MNCPKCDTKMEETEYVYGDTVIYSGGFKCPKCGYEIDEDIPMEE